MYFKDLGFQTYEDYLKSEHWLKVNEQYLNSNLSKYCWICFSKKNLLLHHEDYSILGKELQQQNLRKLVPLCFNCHSGSKNSVHFDENGEKIPIKPDILKDRKYQLRHRYLLSKIKPTTIIQLIGELLYRLLW